MAIILVSILVEWDESLESTIAARRKRTFADQVQQMIGFHQDCLLQSRVPRSSCMRRDQICFEANPASYTRHRYYYYYFKMLTLGKIHVELRNSDDRSLVA